MGWMVIRVRGTIHARRDIVETLERLRLTRPNHATILPETPSVRGMLGKVQGYVTWGEADPATIELLLAQRGRGPDGEPPANAGELARTVAVEGLSGDGPVRPLFRLRAPTGGWRSTKRPFALGGALGYRGRAINDLARAML